MDMSVQGLFVLLLISSWLWTGYEVHAYSSGAPAFQCGPMTPSHPQAPGLGDGPYEVTTTVPGTYMAGQTYSVTVGSTDNTTQLQGLLCQVRDASVARGVIATAEGDFMPSSLLFRNLDCRAENGATSAMSAITHTTQINSNTVSFDWTAPAVRGAASLHVVCTVVQGYLTAHYLHIPSTSFNAPAVAVTPTTVTPTTATPTTVSLASTTTSDTLPTATSDATNTMSPVQTTSAVPPVSPDFNSNACPELTLATSEAERYRANLDCWNRRFAEWYRAYQKWLANSGQGCAVTTSSVPTTNPTNTS